jgi:hypothetical protein
VGNRQPHRQEKMADYLRRRAGTGENATARLRRRRQPAKGLLPGNEHVGRIDAPTLVNVFPEIRSTGILKTGFPVLAPVRLGLPGRGLEPLRIAPPDPKSGASANFATLARGFPTTDLAQILA